MNSLKPILVSLLVLATNVGFSQGIQPLGLLKGNYNIPAGSSSRLTTYCFDKALVTQVGNQYNRLARGAATVTVGNVVYPLEEAIDRGLSSVHILGARSSLY